MAKLITSKTQYMDYEKKYNEALERAKELLLGNEHSNTIRSYFEHIFPELRESEDERMIRKIKSFLSAYDAYYFKNDEWREIEVWLEKQKENPKNTDSIPADCVSNAKCEDRWHKIKDSLPDNGRLVLANDCLGNTLLARYDGEGNWEVSVYDNDDYYCRNTITKWCDIPSEKQKEHQELPLMNGDADLYFDTWRQEVQVPTFRQCFEEGMRYVQRLQKEQKPVEIHNPTDEEIESWRKELTEFKKFATKQAKENQLHISYTRDVMWENFCSELLSFINSRNPAEWSEEDERRIDAICELLENTSAIHPNYSHRKLIIWLKDLRPIKQEWSEKDETAFGDLMWCIEQARKSAKDENDMGNIWFAENWVKNRLKSLRPSWKPSEDEERLINTSISFLKDFADKGYENAVECIDWLKSKLNGNTCE